ncbi:MAG: PTS sugar transporter subunit IIA [Lentisphaeria bacterium]
MMVNNHIKTEIMTLEEVAAYLRLSESVIIDYVNKGDIPAGKFGENWRFRRTDLENWIENKFCSNKDLLADKRESAKVKLSDYLNEEKIIICSDDNKRDLLNRMIDVCARDYSKEQKEALTLGIYAREELMSTAIGLGVAIPHVRIAQVEDLQVVMAVSKEPIFDYESIDEKPVRVAFMIVGRSDQHALHLRILSAISEILKDHNLRQHIINSGSVSEIMNLIHSQE